jgi:hypothetical protein
MNVHRIPSPSPLEGEERNVASVRATFWVGGAESTIPPTRNAAPARIIPPSPSRGEGQLPARFHDGGGHG